MVILGLDPRIGAGRRLAVAGDTDPPIKSEDDGFFCFVLLPLREKVAGGA